jgi:hypothetical protein
MALSNWDTLAVDLSGTPTDGVFISPSGVRCEIRKNCLYCTDKEKRTLSIEHGIARYADVEIASVKGPQNGIFVACWSVQYSGSNPVWTGMIGCGVYAYDNETFVGVSSDSLKFLQEWILRAEIDSEEEIVEYMKKFDDANQDAGDEFHKRRKEYEDLLRTPVFILPEEIAKVKLDNVTRFNQGDAFFANKTGFDVPATEIGQANETIVMQHLKTHNKD